MPRAAQHLVLGADSMTVLGHPSLDCRPQWGNKLSSPPRHLVLTMKTPAYPGPFSSQLT